ncbi:MAG: DEAD/DEAH box helicase, partial [Deltaproteobacteria bacterium]|nr:DEAD/DEAH box helicase [Deltaproteobacteria bacterium]
RAAIVDYFRDEAIIMIATEAAAEGLNLQFCSLVVNYDLPWNPQRIEQRIGRCHRYGQKYDVVVVNFLNKKNAADQRVYELLSEKFRLFSGVFGASDEVLGSIESGVDFEKRIAQIYQNCRTPEEIQSAFDQLQAELDEQIEDRLKTTRQKLLETFDEEVHEKLRVNLRNSREYLNKYENWLWQITRFYLDSHAKFDGRKNSFTLIKNPFPNETIHPGPYRIGKNIEDANIYRVGHPLAQRIIDQCKEKKLPDTELVFKYSDAPAKISVIEPIIGMSGWLSAVNMTITSFETEDYVLLAGICDDGAALDEEQCRRLFFLPATLSPFEKRDSLNKPKEQLEQMLFAEEATILRTIAERNADFFDTEMEKLDKWAEDIKNSLEIKLKELDKDIKFRKTESKKILKLEEKVKAQREIKELERKRNEMRMNLYQSQDEVEDKKEKLLDDVEARLQQNIKKEELFFIKWKVI